MTEHWVNFGELKQRVSMADILGHYGLLDKLKAQKGGDELVGLCPFHQETRGSFHVSLLKNAWQCFGCKRHGNILDFVATKEEVEIRRAALLIQEWFQVRADERTKAIPKASETQRSDSEPKVATVGQEDHDNPPLTFTLKNLDTMHPYLKERGLKKETIEHFDLGYCSRGLLKGRIAIPVHNENRELIAYAGRWPGDPREDTEKYLLPKDFRKSQVVFNLNRARETATENGLILVEGFFSCFWLHQCGLRNVVALMGSSLSDSQRELIVSTVGAQGRITLLFDNDEAGRGCEAQCLEELSEYLYVKVVRLSEPFQQPDNLTETELHQLLS